MVPSIDVWTALQFAGFYHIFSQSPESMERRSTVHYTLINTTTSFTKIGLLLPNHLNLSKPGGHFTYHQV
jgi:hypothetical protein